MMKEENVNIIELMQREFHSDFKYNQELQDTLRELLTLPPYLFPKERIQAWSNTLETQGKEALLNRIHEEMAIYHEPLIGLPSQHDFFSCNADACQLEYLMQELLKNFSIEVISTILQALCRAK